MLVPPVARLTSRQHAIVRRFRHAATHPDADDVLLDGDHLVNAALDASVPVEILLTDGRAPLLVARARAAGADIYEGTHAVIDAASPVRTPTGVVALARWATHDVASTFPASAGGCVLGLCNVQDPGNVGSAIRAADALGAAAVLALDGTADPRGWKAMRGAMGSTFRLPVARGSSRDAIAAARSRGLAIVATVANGGHALDATDLGAPTLILVGSEGAGLPDDIVTLADRRLTISMRAGVESLNVAVTSAILLFEARRQRES